MRAKLSWLTFSIIGGVIVAVILIFIYTFVLKGMILSQVISGALKPWGILIIKLEEADNLGSSFATEFKIGLDPVVIGVGSCYLGGAVPGGHSRKEMESFNTILILNKSLKSDLLQSRLLKDSRSKGELSKCKNGYCYCAARFTLKDNYIHYKKILDSACISNGEREVNQTVFSIPSVVRNLNFDCLKNSLKAVQIFACKEEKYPLYYDGKQVNLIQFFYTRTLFLNKIKKGNSYIISMKFVDECSGEEEYECTVVYDICPYILKDQGIGDW